MYLKNTSPNLYLSLNSLFFLWITECDFAHMHKAYQLSTFKFVFTDSPFKHSHPLIVVFDVISVEMMAFWQGLDNPGFGRGKLADVDIAFGVSDSALTDAFSKFPIKKSPIPAYITDIGTCSRFAHVIPVLVVTRGDVDISVLNALIL